MKKLNKYQIEGERRFDLKVQAHSLQEAANLFRARCGKGVAITSIDGVEIVGICEVSGRVIMPNDAYALDVEGFYILREFAA